MPSKTNNSLKGIKAQKNPAKGAAILKAVKNIFAQKGFLEATITDTAKKAEVSEATIYDYFSSKKGIQKPQREPTILVNVKMDT